jgi:muramoyltetrapeptide carboxypeptidase LdcA involved in peptidoglycan recycling
MSEDAPSPADVDGYLTDLEQLGVFEAAAALVFARPYGYTDQDAEALWDVVARRTEAAGLPVLANFEAGHTDPMITLPLGAPAELNATHKRLRLLEPPTADLAASPAPASVP